MMRRYLLLALALLAAGVESAWAQADYVVHNAIIHTVDTDHPTAEAMAVRGDRILMVGEASRVLNAYPHAPRVDLGGRVVVPGLIDAHAHLLSRGESLLSADLVGTASKEEILARLTDFAADLPDGEWLVGRGWDQNDWPVKEYPTRRDLDSVFPDRPVWLDRIDGHAAWANTAALKAAGFDAIRQAENPEGGMILRDDQGEPTGIFIDAATMLIARHLPRTDDARRKEALRRVLEETARLGLTGVHDAGISMDDISLYRTAIDEGDFDLRLYGMIGGVGPTLDSMCESGPILGYGDRLTVRSVKLYIDGALGSRGAALLEPYADDPANMGLLQMEPSALTKSVKRVIRCGFQAMTHAIGDRGNRVALQAYEEAMKELGPGPGRHRIEHAQIVHPDDFVLFRELDVIASMQPTHATSDMYWAGDRVGEARLAGAYSWRTFLEKGVALAFGSDFPVESVNPLLGFYAAVTRQDAAGWPEGGWLPEQRLSRMEALRAFTIGAAYAAFQEDEVGSLEPGKYADFVVLSKDIMTIPPSEILETEVAATYLGGRRIYGTSDP